MHREGYGAVTFFTVAALIMTSAGWRFYPGPVFQSLALLMWALLGFTIYFFRDPERHSDAPPDAIISPADGVVVEVLETDEPLFFGERVRKIGIFMSPLDVHVNRAPIEGEVTYFRSQDGSFMRADLAEAAVRNEQAIIGMEKDGRKVLFKQIAGFVARRICCEVRSGDYLQRGERIGMIKFGSRVDVYLPLSVQITVSLRERLRAGESIIGVFANVS